MKLLVITQKVDRNDPVLGFFHQWLFKLSFQFEKVEVVCLQKGEYDLPKNVQVFSLGKESGQNKFKYIFNFFKICFFQSLKYDAVFVHMNQEYVLLGGWFWKIFGKKIFLWRNHPKGNLFTYLAVWLVDQVFCTSPYSFTNYSFTKLFKKTILMPVGIDVEQFADNESISRENKILSLGRISPIKNIHLMIEAVKILKERGVSFVLDIVGDPVNPEDVEYKNQLINKSQGLPVNFLPGVPNKMTPEIYRGHEIFINLTPSGSFDKTILESAASGCIPITYNKVFPQYGDSGDSNLADLTPKTIADKLEYYLKVPQELKIQISRQLRGYVLENHSLDALIELLCIKIKG